jgi:hypothetical protein
MNGKFLLKSGLIATGVIYTWAGAFHPETSTYQDIAKTCSQLAAGMTSSPVQVIGALKFVTVAPDKALSAYAYYRATRDVETQYEWPSS